MMLFEGEAEAIDEVKRLAEKYGYGNLIQRLRNAWSERLQKGGLAQETADMMAGHACAWCGVDSRTGKRARPESVKGEKL